MFPFSVDNALLTGLIVTVDGEELAIEPVFYSHTTSYRIETTADEVTIKATTFDAAVVATLDKAALRKRRDQDLYVIDSSNGTR